MNGIVTGGWNFVLAAYIVTGTVLVAYSIHTIHELRQKLAIRAALISVTKGTSS
jgi:hypothetical protein